MEAAGCRREDLDAVSLQQIVHERIESPYFNRRPHHWYLPTPLKVYEFEQLASELAVEGEARLLDLGCGIGLQSVILAERGWEVTGVDPDIARIEKAKRRSRTVRMSRGSVSFAASTIEDARFPDHTFDAAVSFCVLEHIPDLESCLAEVRRVLKPGMVFRATVDCLGNVDDPQLLERHHREYAVHRLFDTATAPEYFQAHGFKVEECRAIMKGQASIRELYRSPTDRPLSTLSKRRVVRAIRREDAHITSSAGVMLLLQLRSG